MVTQLKLIKVSKHGRAWQAAVCTNYAVRTLATHGKRRALQMACTLCKHVSTRTVVDRQIHVNARNGYGTHHAIGTKGQLTGIGGVFFGRVNSKSVRDAFAHKRLVVGTGAFKPILRVILRQLLNLLCVVSQNGRRAPFVPRAGYKRIKQQRQAKQKDNSQCNGRQGDTRAPKTHLIRCINSINLKAHDRPSPLIIYTSRTMCSHIRACVRGDTNYEKPWRIS